MVHPRRFAVSLLTVLLLAAAGCEGTPQVKVLSRASFVLDAEKKKTTVATHVAEEVTLQLPPIPVAGYHWQIFAHDARFLKQTSEITAPQGPERISSVRFVALRQVPRTLVRFLLIKESEAKETQPIDEHDVTVTIK